MAQSEVQESIAKSLILRATGLVSHNRLTWYNKSITFVGQPYNADNTEKSIMNQSVLNPPKLRWLPYFLKGQCHPQFDRKIWI
jgi:hypothetical protein